ncbi:MAG: FtsQ-type POTRA domain-containing protein [Treponema sp.]|nr:FtsQ-type POTRA domain-containing protein [Treponema sp.]
MGATVSLNRELGARDFMMKGSSASSSSFDIGKKEKKKDPRITIAKIVVLILLVLLALEAVFYTMVIPCLAPVKVEFSGLKTVPSQLLMQKLEDMGTVTWIEFDSGRAVDALSSFSCIESVAVDKIFPDKVVISIKERQPVAKTIMNINGRSQTVQISENGVIFTNTASVSADSNIPIISGLPIEGMQLGMRFPSKFRPLMAQIASIGALPQKYFSAISEIMVLQKEYGNYELVLYPVQSQQSHVKVLADRSLNEEALKRMLVILDVVNSIELNVSEIDLRYGSISYKANAQSAVNR